MALQADLARLDAVFRGRAIRRQKGSAVAISRLFAGLTPRDLLEDDSPKVDRWLDQSESIVSAVRESVVDDTVDYFQQIRQLTTPGAPPARFDRAPRAEPEQIRTSLFVTGVVGSRQRLGSLEVEDDASVLEALTTSGDAAGGAGGRHVFNGARDQIISAAQSDRRTIGWVRVTSLQPCYFCSALASRGPVYQGDSFDESDPRFEGAGQHKVHDNCSCSLRPVYSRSYDEWPELSQRYEQQWKDLGQSLGRSPSLKDWRHAYEGRRSA